jgi:hypothetical protein
MFNHNQDFKKVGEGLALIRKYIYTRKGIDIGLIYYPLSQKQWELYYKALKIARNYFSSKS